MIPHTPKQNYIFERKNMTIMEMARCMLEETYGEKLWELQFTPWISVIKNIFKEKILLIYEHERNPTYLTLGCLVVKHSPTLFMRK